MKKIIWLIASWLMVVALLVTSCAKAEEKAPAAPAVKEAAPAVKEAAPAVKEAAPAETGNMVKLTLTKLDGTKVEKLVEKPQYGGTLNQLSTARQSCGFDPAMATNWTTHRTVHLTYDKLLTGDFYRSESGTNEAGFDLTLAFDYPLVVPQLAERWEVVDTETLRYYLRKGVRFHNKPPVNGRELTADDVVFSLRRAYETPTSYMSYSVAEQDHPVSIQAIDKYTVEVKGRPGTSIYSIHEIIVTWGKIYAPEVITKYGNLNDWRNAIGTGPYTIEDHVPLSMTTCVRNPDYWMKDPLFPENNLPYPDTVRHIFIEDPSTQQAAFRTGQLDSISASNYPELQGVLKTNPTIGIRKKLAASPNEVGFRMDGPFPWAPADDPKARKVRQAMNMAIDRKSVVELLFKGYGKELNFPVLECAEWSSMWRPLETLPANIQEIYTYNPTKAKQLLAEAGYPNGFKSKVVGRPEQEAQDDLVLQQQYFADIGIDMQITVPEMGAYSAMEATRGHEQGFQGGSALSDVWRQWKFDPNRGYNSSMVDDPVINKFLADFSRLVTDDPARRKLMREEYVPYVLEQAYYVIFPSRQTFAVYQPWVKHFCGETHYGPGNYGNWTIYAWVDQELKKQMGGR